MKVWVDDEREAPRDWIRAWDYDEAIVLLMSGEVTYLSLDHDLGEGKTGYDIACWVEREVHTNGFSPPVMEVHSANPVGRKNIQAAIDSIKRSGRQRTTEEVT